MCLKLMHKTDVRAGQRQRQAPDPSILGAAGQILNFFLKDSAMVLKVSLWFNGGIACVFLRSSSSTI